LIGVRYIETVRGIYARLLGETLKPGASDQAPPPADTILTSLAEAERKAGVTLHTASLEQTLADTLRRLWSDKTDKTAQSVLVGEALVQARDLTSPLGADSNLA